MLQEQIKSAEQDGRYIGPSAGPHSELAARDVNVSSLAVSALIEGLAS